MRVAGRQIGLAAALITGWAAAALVAGCGSDGEVRGLLPAARADALSRDLAQVRELAEAGDCEAARTAADQLNAEVSGLGADVDPRLREALSDGVGRLGLLIDEPGACEEPTRTTTTQTTTTETVPPVITTPPAQPEKPKKPKKDEDADDEPALPGEGPDEAPAGTEGGGVISPEEQGSGQEPLPSEGGGVGAQ